MNAWKMDRNARPTQESYTPLFDAVVQDLGLSAAAVYGRVWRYFQMNEHVCRASLKKIGESIGLDRATVLRHLKVLCTRGYLEDRTPRLRNRPHIYVVTEKTQNSGSIPKSVAESNAYDVGVALGNIGDAEKNITAEHRNSGVAESYMKKEIKREEETDQENMYLHIFRSCSPNHWGKNITGWRKVERLLESAVFELMDGTLTISGLGENAGVFQDRYARYFEQDLIGAFAEQVTVIFQE